MPSKGRIQSTSFQSLLLELGVNPNGIPFDLQSEVLPVVLVGGTVSFVAAPTPAYAVTDWFGAGIQIAPAAGFVLADTGPLAVGDFKMQISFGADETNRFDLEWRNALNTVNLRANSLFVPANTTQVLIVRVLIENANERLRVTNLAAGGVGQVYGATILAKV